jgi:hypothetical protein
MGFLDRFGRLARAQDDGTVVLRLGEAERELFTTLLPQLRALLVDEAGDATTGPTDPLLARLFPDALPGDAEGAEAYRSLVHDDLLGARLNAIDLLEAGLEHDPIVLDEEQLGTWMRTVNELRLVLGTRLDVSEEDELGRLDSSDAPLYGAYAWLGVLLEDLVHAATGQLPPPSSDGPT